MSALAPRRQLPMRPLTASTDPRARELVVCLRAREVGRTVVALRTLAGYTHGECGEDAREQAARRLLFARWLVRTGRLGEGRRQLSTRTRLGGWLVAAMRLAFAGAAS